jgi:hypothetical protein
MRNAEITKGLVSQSLYAEVNRKKSLSWLAYGKLHGVTKYIYGSVVFLPWCLIEALWFLFGDFVTV